MTRHRRAITIRIIKAPGRKETWSGWGRCWGSDPTTTRQLRTSYENLCINYSIFHDLPPLIYHSFPFSSSKTTEKLLARLDFIVISPPNGEWKLANEEGKMKGQKKCTELLVVADGRNRGQRIRSAPRGARLARRARSTTAARLHVTLKRTRIRVYHRRVLSLVLWRKLRFAWNETRLGWRNAVYSTCT